MKSRTIAILLVALAFAYQVVWTAIVDGSLAKSPATAARVWPGHPHAAMRAGLNDIGIASVQGRPVEKATIAKIIGAASRAPLLPEPFLVRGVQAQLAGRQSIAAEAFARAKLLEPRSIAARFFLADHWLKVGDIDRVLNEVTELSRLVPGSRQTMAPQLALFARTPGGAQRLKDALRDKPDIRTSLLTTLSLSPANADLVLFLAQGNELSTEWREQLVKTLVAAGDYRRAYSLWLPLVGQSGPGPLLFDPGFRAVATAPPPFAWTLSSDGNGIAEAVPGGLHVIHYGRQDSELAAQTLLLAPGRYRFASPTRAGSVGPGAVQWTLTCLGSNKHIMKAKLAQLAAMKNASMELDVPADCAAQRLVLTGIAPEFPETADITIAGVSLTKVAKQ